MAEVLVQAIASSMQITVIVCSRREAAVDKLAMDFIEGHWLLSMVVDIYARKMRVQIQNGTMIDGFGQLLASNSHQLGLVEADFESYIAAVLVD